MSDGEKILLANGQGRDLLPPNATDLERKLSLYSSRIEALNVMTEKLLDGGLCPDDMLPWLAWSMSVDSWRNDWNDGIKRDLIKDSIKSHKRQGTRASVRHAVRMVLAFADNPSREDVNDINDYDNSFQIKEWWEKDELDGVAKTAMRQPHTFEIKLLIGKGVLGSRGILGRELYQELRKAIDTVKPISTRYTLSIGGAKFESACSVVPRLRNSMYARFLVTPTFALKLNADMSAQYNMRLSRHQNYLVKPIPKLVFSSQLNVQEGIKVFRYCTWKVQPPYLEK